MKYHGDHNPYNVTALWEVRLRPEMIEQIRLAATKYNATMSWVVRWCTFRLARLKRVNQEKLHQMAENLREKNQPKPMPADQLHRLRVCLYGDDERIFLELKYRFGLSTTMIVRIALKLFLRYLLTKMISDREFFYFGIKFFSVTRIRYSMRYRVPQVDFHFKQFFKFEDYWGTPLGALPLHLKT